MVEGVLAQSAWEDLDSISDYIAEDSIRYSIEFTNELLDKIQQLETFPDSGKMVLEFNNPFFRELIHKKYRIVYRYKPEEAKAIILRIIHGSKLMEI